MSGHLKNFFIWFLVIILLLAMFNLMQGKGSSNNLAFSDFMQQVENGEVRDVTIQGRNIEGYYQNDAGRFTTFSPEYPDLVPSLRENGVRVNAVPTESTTGSIFGILLGWVPILLLIGVWIFFMKQMQGGGKGGAMGFGKSRAKMLTEKSGKVTFADVSGVDEAKEELTEIVDFLKEPEKFQKLGAKIPKGCLLVGAPGTGKTLLARAVAGESGVPFFTISGSDFVEMFVGVGASRVRDMFEQGKRSAPCIIFIDEIDAVGRHRGAGIGGGNDEREQTLNQLLVEMDGFEDNEGIIILAATNRPDVLDPALLRPGRFDRQIVVPNPDVKGRQEILGIHMKKVPIAPDVDSKVIARGTPGFSGADLSNLVNEAALLAARRNKKVVTMSEMEEAKDKVMMGAERKSMVIKDEEKKLTAYHEAGHAIVGINCPDSDPIHKATIIPRGRALGMVMRLPEDDKLSVTRDQLNADLAVAMGGRVAEELIFGNGKVTSGASSDIQQATRIARSMVTKWGMSDKIGPIAHSTKSSDPYSGNASEDQVSQETAKLIDSEIKFLVEEGYKLATDILTKKRKDLNKLAEALLEYETLSGDDITNILKGNKIRDNDDDENGKPNDCIKSAIPKIGAKKSPKKKNTKPKPPSGEPQGA